MAFSPNVGYKFDRNSSVSGNQRKYMNISELYRSSSLCSRT